MRSPARPILRRLLVAVGTCAVLGLLVGHGLGATAVARVGSVGAGRTTVGHVRSGGRDIVATSSGTHIDVLRHAIDRSLVRRTQPWALDGVLVRLVAAGIAATLLVAIRERRRRLTLRAQLPARAPPLLALG